MKKSIIFFSYNGNIYIITIIIVTIIIIIFANKEHFFSRLKKEVIKNIADR